MSSGKILVAQGGGPTAVINQSLVGVALEARRFQNVKLVYGARHGVRGIVDENFVDLTQETSHNLEAVARTPASALGSTRDKPDLKYCQEIFKVLKAHEIEHFFYIGGNDSSDTVRIVAAEAAAARYPLRCVHIPKTIDNDLVGNDHTPGYPSAARFVAQAFAGANLDNAALPGVYLGVVMGQPVPARVQLGDRIARQAGQVDQRLHAGQVLAPHRVRDRMVIQCLEGRFEFEAMGRRLVLGAGDLCHLPPDEEHAVRAFDAQALD